MSTLPSIEAILLEIHQSFGGKGYPTTKKNNFATGQTSLATSQAMWLEILEAVFDALNMDTDARMNASDNFRSFGDEYKLLELNTWTLDADQRQILWAVLAHICVPSLARHVGLWSLEQVLDKGMPGGHFWYLPEPCVVDGQACFTSPLTLPVAHVVDWLLDLLGMPLEKLANQRSESTDSVHESLRRSLYNWRNATPISSNAIEKYFSDEVALDFNGTFSLDHSRSPAQQFADALRFVNRKALTADKLRLEIPMEQPGRLKLILDGQANEAEQAEFVKHLSERYATPYMSIIRQRLQLARAVQGGYIRLLKFLCPGVDRQCPDPSQNKLLQLIAIYKLIYNLTVEAWRECRNQDEATKRAWFERHLSELVWCDQYLFILISRRKTAFLELAHWLTRRFYEMQPDAELEDYFGWDEASARLIIQRNAERKTAFADEINSELRLVARMRISFPWRALQGESRYWVVSQVAQSKDIGSIARQAALQRLRDLATTPAQTVSAILLELDGYLNGERLHRPKDTQAKVQTLLEEAETSAGYELWKAAILQYKAKHLLACNDFDGATKLFRVALEAGLERNYGPLRGEVGRDCLAVEVANHKLIVNNHEKYYRAMLDGGIMTGDKEIPPIEETARWAYDYFWNDLYKPYPGLPYQKSRSLDVFKKPFEELLHLFMSGDSDGLQKWIKTNRPLFKSTLPDVEGNSVLMTLIKIYLGNRSVLLSLQHMPIAEGQPEARRFESMLRHWHQFLGQLAKENPQQLNMADLKKQTPLMLLAEAGDAELTAIMLQAGADPDMQDWHGMTALHSACKSRVDDCVDALLDHPCKLDKWTVDERSPLHTASWSGNIHAVKRLSQLAPELAWKQDNHGMTPLELVECLVEHPDAFKELAEQCSKNSGRCASRQELETIKQLLEEVPPPGH